MKINEDKALFKLAAYCSKAERCEFDIKRKIESWQLDNDQTNRIIDRLKKDNFLNEDRYCKAYIKDKILFNKWGSTKIKFELRKKSIPEYVIENCFEAFEDEIFDEPLLKVLGSKIKNIKAKDNYERQNKLVRFALGRGYSLEQIKKCLIQLDEEGI